MTNPDAPKQPDEASADIDVAKLRAAADMVVPPVAPPPAGPNPDGVAEHVEEIAEDMLDLLRRVQSVEQSQAELVNRLGDVQRGLHDAWRAVAVELDSMRRDLLGERAALGARSACAAIVQPLHSLRVMAEGLDPATDECALRQVQGVIATLANTVVALGFSEFKATEGDPFDPVRMECLGLEPGPAGRVTRAVQPGVASGDSVLKPCAVMVGVGAAPQEEKTK